MKICCSLFILTFRMNEMKLTSLKNEFKYFSWTPWNHFTDKMFWNKLLYLKENVTVVQWNVTQNRVECGYSDVFLWVRTELVLFALAFWHPLRHLELTLTSLGAMERCGLEWPFFRTKDYTLIWYLSRITRRGNAFSNVQQSSMLNAIYSGQIL